MGNLKLITFLDFLMEYIVFSKGKHPTLCINVIHWKIIYLLVHNAIDPFWFKKVQKNSLTAVNKKCHVFKYKFWCQSKKKNIARFKLLLTGR